MRLTARIIFCCSIVFVLFVSTVSAFNNRSGGGHAPITGIAAQLRLDASTDRKFQDWLGKEALPYFLTGVHDEDCTPIINGVAQEVPYELDWPTGPNKNHWGNFFEHFYNPLNGAGYSRFRNTIARSQDYVKLIKGLICATNKKRYDDLSPTGKSYVNDYFGRIHHLIEDMGVSYHTKLEAHWPNKPIEDYVKNNWASLASSDLFKKELNETRPTKGECIDPTILLTKLASWSNLLPDKNQYWVCTDDVPTPGPAACVLNEAKLAMNSTWMAARATKFASAYIDQIYSAITSDCLCSDDDPPLPFIPDRNGRTVPSSDAPDDNFSVSDWSWKRTQFNLSQYELLGLYSPLAVKKGSLVPHLMRKTMETYAQIKALPADATEAQKAALEKQLADIAGAIQMQPLTDAESSPDVVILQNGFYEHMTVLLNENKEPVKILPVEFDPSIVKDHPVLVIPSGGLYGLKNSATFKASLDEYVKLGGTLIVFSQQYGYDFALVPVPPEEDGTSRVVTGYGWAQDQSCYADSVYAVSYHQILAGQNRSTPSFAVDGYFTDFPSSAAVILKRSANGQPAMIMYDHGLGKVVITSMYVDFASQTHQMSVEETVLMRDLIVWAKQPAQLPEVKPGQNITIPVPINNITNTDVSQIKVRLRTPDRYGIVSEQIVNTGLPAHGATVITLQYTAPADFGIYHMDYFLLDEQGNVIQPETETDSGRFAVSNPPEDLSNTSELNFSVQSDKEYYPLNSQVTFTVIAWTNGAQDAKVKCVYFLPHLSNENGRKSLVIPAKSSTSFNVVVPRITWQGWLMSNFFDESGKRVGSARKGVFVLSPSVSVDVQTEKTEYGPEETVSMAVTLQNNQSVSYSTTARIRVASSSGKTVYENVLEVRLDGNRGYSRNMAFVLPADTRGGSSYIVMVEAFDAEDKKVGGASTGFVIPMNQVSVVVGPHQIPLVAGSNIFPFVAENVGKTRANSQVLGVTIKDPEDNTVYSGSLPFSLSIGEKKNLDVAALIPLLKFGDYTLVYTVSDATGAGSPTTIIIPNRLSLLLALDKPAYRIREEAVITATVTNTGKSNIDTVQVGMNVPDMAFSRTETVNILQGQSLTFRYSIPIPEVVAAGSHWAEATCILPSGSSVSHYGNIQIPNARLKVQHSGTALVSPGDTVKLEIENTGGVDTSYAGGSISVLDEIGTSLYQGDIVGATLLANEKKALVDILIPDQAGQGQIHLTVKIHDSKGELTGFFSKVLMVVGLQAELQTRMDKSLYLETESVATISDIMNGVVPLSNADLNLSIYQIKNKTTDEFFHFLPKKGWALLDPADIAIGPEGFVYVTDYANHRIQKFDRQGVLINRWGTEGEGDGQFYYPRAVVAGPDGFVYVVDEYHNRIQKFDGNGNFVAKWGGFGSADGQFNRPVDIALSSDGFLYIADSNNCRIQKFDTKGNFITKWGSKGNGDGQFNMPNGLAVTSDNFVYVSEFGWNEMDGNDRIQKFDGNGNFLAKWGSKGREDGQFMSAYGIVVSPDGSVYVADYDRIQKFDGNGNFVAKWGAWGEGPGQLENPWGVAMDANGLIYVADQGNERIQILDNGGEFVNDWGRESDVDGRFSSDLNYMAMNPEGFLYVVDSGNSRVQKFDRNGSLVTTWGDFGDKEGQFDHPTGITVSPDGFIYVADDRLNRVQKFDEKGNFVAGWEITVGDNGMPPAPKGVAAGTDGTIYVVVANHVERFGRDGELVNRWGSYGSGNGQFYRPEGIAVGPDGSVYVVDAGNYRIQRFHGDGRFIELWEGNGDGELYWPQGIAVDPGGNIYVTDAYDDFVKKWDSHGVFLARWGTPFAGTEYDHQFYLPAGIAVSPDGSVYVGDENGHIQIMDTAGKELIAQRTVSVDQATSTAQRYTTDIGLLNRTGKFYVEGELVNSFDQMLSRSIYPFYVAKDGVIALLSTEKPVYKPGETVRIQGEIRNVSSVDMKALSFSLAQKTKDGSECLYSATFDLPGQASRPFTLTTLPTANGRYLLTGTTMRENLEIAEVADQYNVDTPAIAVNIVAPDTAGNETFDVIAEFTNRGTIDLRLNIFSSADGQSQLVLIPAGTQKSLVYGQKITQDTLYTFEITGDVNQTIERTVRFGYDLNISSDADSLYPEGKVVLPAYLFNPGILDETVTVNMVLRPTGITLEKTYFIPKNEGISDVLYFDLSEGDYQLTIASQSPKAESNTIFSVRKQAGLIMTSPVIASDTGGAITVATDLTNQGYGDVTVSGRISVVGLDGTLLWQSSQNVSLAASQPPATQQVLLSFNQASIPAGTYSVVVDVIGSNGAVICSQSIPYTVQGAKFVLTQTPSPLSVSPGEEVNFIFKVSNAGGKDGTAELTLKAYDLMVFTQRQWISSGETREFQFSFALPNDLEEKDYFADYEVKGDGTVITNGQVKYHLKGINISVNAGLDKDSYREGETAHLTLNISPAPRSSSVNCFAKAAYGSYEDKKTFTLSDSTMIAFDVPLAKISGDKLAYGIYHESGRAIHLNSLYLYKASDTLMISTNKQVYDQGETVAIIINGNQPGTLTINGPGNYFDTFAFSGNATRNIPLPAVAAAGTYPVEATLKLASGETVSATHPIDIAGIKVKVKETTLDKGKYAASDTIKLGLKVESNTNMPASLRTWVIDPSGKSTYLGEKVIDLTAIEPLAVSGEYPLSTKVSGIHRLIYGIYSSRLLLASGPEAFDVGNAVLYSITPDREDYPLGSEQVLLKCSMHGITEADLAIELDGVMVKRQSVSLNGFQNLMVPLDSVNPGPHTVKAILSSGGLSSAREASFTYGSGLADLVPDVWGSASSIGEDTIMKLAASVANQGRMPSQAANLNLLDGDTSLNIFSVPVLPNGGMKSFDYSWQVMGKAGEHSVKVIADPSNAVSEFTRKNNTVERTITIPDIISFTKTAKESYRMMEQVAIDTKIINLTQSAFYPNLTVITVVKDALGAEVFKKSSSFSAPPSKGSVFSDNWVPTGLSEGIYTIDQTIMDGSDKKASSSKSITILKGSGFVVAVSKDTFILRQGMSDSFAVTVDPLAGWTGAVSLRMEGMPDGMNVSFTQSAFTPPGSTLTNITTGGIRPALYPLTLVATGLMNGETVTQAIPIVVHVQGFDITLAPQSVTIKQLESAKIAISAVSQNGYSGSIALSGPGGVKGATITMDKRSLTVPDTVMVHVETSKFTRPGAYTITVSANDGVMTKKSDFLLSVMEEPSIAPGFVVTPGPGPKNPAWIRLFTRDYKPVADFTAFPTKYGANAVMGDLDGDGDDEIIVAPGPDPKAGGILRIYRKNGTLIAEKEVFDSRSGLNLAVGDIDGDLKEEIVAGTGPALFTTPKVKILSWAGSGLVDTGLNFVPYEKTKIGMGILLGVNVALGDVDNDGILEIITGPGPSLSNPGRIRVFKIDTSAGMGKWKVGPTLLDFTVHDRKSHPILFGVNVTTGDIDGDGGAELVAGMGPNPDNTSSVQVYETDGTFSASFDAYPDDQAHRHWFRFGSYVAAGDVDHDGKAEIITGLGPSPENAPWVRLFKGDGTAVNEGFLAYPDTMRFGVKVSMGNVGE